MDTEADRGGLEYSNDSSTTGQLSHHTISYPDISEEIARNCRVWALRILRSLPDLLLNDSWTADGTRNITGVRNYYLPDQKIYAMQKNLAVDLCRKLEAMLAT